MNNFAVLDIIQTYPPGFIYITITTDVPVHLTAYYTDKEPLRHSTSRTQRGLTFSWGAYFCFVAWETCEQTEPGDTLIHTFECIPWISCQTKWVAFRGTIGGELSPSVSPIFKKHRPIMAWWLLLSEPWQVTFEPPPMNLALLEEWTTTFQPPDLTRVILEEWTPSAITTITRRLVPGNNSAHIWHTGIAWDWFIDGVDAVVGHLQPTQTKQGSPARFENIPIPQNSIILSAFITYRAWANYNLDTVASYLHAEKSPNSQPLSTIPNYFSRPRTTAFMDWTPIPHWVDFTEYNTPDIHLLIQEVIDQPAWSPGNAIMLFWQDHDGRSTPTPFTERRAWQIVDDWPQNAPLLTIKYGTP